MSAPAGIEGLAFWGTHNVDFVLALALRQVSAVDAECPVVHFQSNLDVRLQWIRGLPSGGSPSQSSRARKLNVKSLAGYVCRICQPTRTPTSVRWLPPPIRVLPQVLVLKKMIKKRRAGQEPQSEIAKKRYKAKMLALSWMMMSCHCAGQK